MGAGDHKVIEGVREGLIIQGVVPPLLLQHAETSLGHRCTEGLPITDVSWVHDIGRIMMGDGVEKVEAGSHVQRAII